MTCPEQRLFQAVVNQTFIDATAPIPELPAKPPRTASPTERKRYSVRKRTHETMARDQIDARKWLLKGTRDFAEICQYAGYEPAYIRMKARKLADAGWPDLPQQRESMAAEAA